ncbi:hypothetical protein GCM10027456_42710 [Kineosporia babensis]
MVPESEFRKPIFTALPEVSTQLSAGAADPDSPALAPQALSARAAARAMVTALRRVDFEE